MNDHFKEAFDRVKAEEELKRKTKVFLARKTQGYKRARRINYQKLIPLTACFLFLFAGGHWLYFTPTAEISIDINPSIELGVNRFDKVISLSSYNDDGRELAGSFNVKYTDYTEAVDKILEDQRIVSLLSDDGYMTITVVGAEGKQSSRIFSEMQSCTAGRSNMHCYSADSKEVAGAHDMGLSYGKYRAFLEAQALDPDLMPEEAEGMTMREIRDLIDTLSGDSEDPGRKGGNGGHRHRGRGNGR